MKKSISNYWQPQNWQKLCIGKYSSVITNRFYSLVTSLNHNWVSFFLLFLFFFYFFIFFLLSLPLSTIAPPPPPLDHPYPSRPICLLLSFSSFSTSFSKFNNHYHWCSLPMRAHVVYEPPQHHRATTASPPSHNCNVISSFSSTFSFSSSFSSSSLLNI